MNYWSIGRLQMDLFIHFQAISNDENNVLLNRVNISKFQIIAA